MRHAAWSVAATLFAAAQLPAQSLAARVDAVKNGTVVMSFATRPGVCRSVGPWGCDTGPVRVAIGRADGQVVSIRESVGGRVSTGAQETDLGTVSAPDAARYLLVLARAAAGRSADDAIAAASFADSVDVTPELTTIVRDANAPLGSRKQAMFWLGQSATPTSNLLRLDGAANGTALREQFIFVLSQRGDDAALDKLIDIAKHDADRELRKRAMFWLGQSRDPKALKFIRDILTG